jgi:gliding motility-associated-like protein
MVCVVTETIQIEVTPEVDPCYWLKGISPNGDGQNDAFYVNCNEDYPNSTMQVFNRWGDQVWDSEGHYVNNFEGKNGRGEILPDGTYYYIYEYKDGSGRKHAGFVQITR